MRKSVFLFVVGVLIAFFTDSFALGDNATKEKILLKDLRRLSETVQGHYADLVGFLGKNAGPVIGIGMISRRLADENGFKVLRIFKNKPADMAGLKEGDIIIALDGTSFDSWEELRRALAADNQPGRMLTFTVRRAEENITVKVKTGILRADKTAEAKKLLAAIRKESRPILDEVKERLGALGQKVRSGSLQPGTGFHQDPDVLRAHDTVTKFLSWYEQRNKEAEDLLRIRYE